MHHLLLAYELRREVIFSVCLSVTRGVLHPLVPGSFSGLWLQVLSREVPQPLVSGSFSSLWSQVFSRGAPWFQVLSASYPNQGLFPNQGQVTIRAVCLLQFPTGGLYCFVFVVKCEHW